MNTTDPVKHDDDNDLIQPNDKKDVSLRELHDPIEGDSAVISWRGNSEVKSHAGMCQYSLLLHLCTSTAAELAVTLAL